ncbi:MAG: hypothetical protein LBV61_03530 [Burkholderiaceae bacterium]|jgi:hypothetical protein|nr:hypothetical protein [Burkholderiaceae bacterium]
MPETPLPFDFSAYIPGFDYLRKLARGQAASSTQTLPGIANLSNWIAPTLSVEEVDKRLREMRAVQFWLEQNLIALKASVQALEVQKMTLSTLRGMNLRMQDLSETLANSAKGVAAAQTPGKAAHKATGKPAGNASLIDPMQWWNALTEQFQSIAAQALHGAASAVPPSLPSAIPGSAGPSAAQVPAASESSAAAAPKAAASEPPAAAKTTPARKRAAPVARKRASKKASGGA